MEKELKDQNERNIKAATSDAKTIDKRIEQLREQLAELEKEKKFQEQKEKRIKELQEQSKFKKQNIEQLKLEIKKQQTQFDKHVQDAELLYSELQKVEADKEKSEKSIKKAKEDLDQQYKDIKLLEQQIQKTETEEYPAIIKAETEKKVAGKAV